MDLIFELLKDYADFQQAGGKDTEGMLEYKITNESMKQLQQLITNIWIAQGGHELQVGVEALKGSKSPANKRELGNAKMALFAWLAEIRAYLVGGWNYNSIYKSAGKRGTKQVDRVINTESGMEEGLTETAAFPGFNPVPGDVYCVPQERSAKEVDTILRTAPVGDPKNEAWLPCPDETRVQILEQIKPGSRESYQCKNEYMLRRLFSSKSLDDVKDWLKAQETEKAKQTVQKKMRAYQEKMGFSGEDFGGEIDDVAAEGDEGEEGAEEGVETQEGKDASEADSKEGSDADAEKKKKKKKKEKPETFDELSGHTIYQISKGRPVSFFLDGWLAMRATLEQGKPLSEEEIDILKRYGFWSEQEKRYSLNLTIRSRKSG